MTTVLYILTTFLFIRVISLLISISNEKKIIKQGAKQHGKFNSLLLSLVHTIFYLSAFYEAYTNQTPFNENSQIGFYFLVFSYIMLFYVIYELRAVWTVKIYITPNHQIVDSFLFKTIRHPNYFLNIIPELVGVGLLCNAWNTMKYVLPFYFVILLIRIIQEEKAMKNIKPL